MVTGVEVAGLVLAIFPLLVKGVGSYVEGIEHIKRWRRYSWELKSYARRLRSQRVRYINTLELLFDGIVESEEELAALINDAGGKIWYEAKYAEKLKSRLDHSYDHFLEALGEMIATLSGLAHKLGMDQNGQVSFTLFILKKHDSHKYCRLHGTNTLRSNVK